MYTIIILFLVAIGFIFSYLFKVLYNYHKNDEWLTNLIKHRNKLKKESYVYPFFEFIGGLFIALGFLWVILWIAQVTSIDKLF